MDEVIIIGAFANDYKGCLNVDSEGQAKLTITLDATQLAPLLSAFAQYKDKQIEMRLKPIEEADSPLPAIEKKAYKG